MISAFATRGDRASDRTVDGRRLRDWVRGANIHDDFTLENHGFVHPDYMSTASLNMTNAVVYRLLGKAAPDACLHNARPVYENLKRLTLPDGSLFYPNGTDWNLHRLDVTASLHAQMERLAGDPQAGALADAALTTLEKMQARNADGRTFVPGEFPSYATHEGQVGWMYAVGTMVTKLWAAPRAKSIAVVWKELEGATMFDDARLFVVRSAKAVISFSWGLRVMGQTIPMDADPILYAMNRSYVGVPGPLPADGGKPSRIGIGSQGLEALLSSDPMTLRTALPGLENGGMHLTASTSRGQTFSFVALPTGKSVYMERWNRAALGGLIALLREAHWVYGRIERRVAGDERTWLNVDDRLGFAVSGGGGFKSWPETQLTLVALNAAPKGDAVIVTMPGATASETREFAGSGWRLDTRHPDLCAVLVDGYLVATNFSPHPTEAEVIVGGVRRKVAVSGISTRVLR